MTEQLAGDGFPRIEASVLPDGIPRGWLESGLQLQDPRFVGLGICMSFSSVFVDVLEQAWGNAQAY